MTAVLPRPGYDPVFAGWYSLNGNGELTGTTWVEESGFLTGPVMITNTHSVGVVHDAVIEYINGMEKDVEVSWSLPVVGETWDGRLNDINGFHVKRGHVFMALENAVGGAVDMGNVGGGTGMVCYRFKGGIGSSSRLVGDYTVGVLVQANYGLREQLTVAGVPVGAEITEDMPTFAGEDMGSIIVVLATDAPLLPYQLKRLARRVPMGIARVGGYSGNGSGDIFIAFSTANKGAWKKNGVSDVEMMSNEDMNPLFEATVDCVEESIVNALVSAETMTGINDNKVYRLPHDRLRQVLRKYNRLEEMN